VLQSGASAAAACYQAASPALARLLRDEIVAAYGQELPPAAIDDLVRGRGRIPRQRTTLYGDAPAERRAAAFAAPPLAQRVNTPARRWERHREAAAAGA
jgi:FO synthase